jgi:hypothetical protein
MLEDLVSLKQQEEGFTVVKVAKTNFLNSQIIKSSYFQYSLLSFIQMVIRIVQGIHNRNLMNYNEFCGKCIESLMKIIDDCPPNKTYTFHPKITLFACFSLK